MTEPLRFGARLRHWFREGHRTALLYGGIGVPDGAVFTPLESF